MCGRFTLTQPAYIAARFNVGEIPPQDREYLDPRFNVAPTQRIVVIPSKDGKRELRTMRWGLIPGWAKDASVGARLINARAEGIAEKPSFRNAFKYRRCLIPADGFYEWQQTASGKRPMRITLASGDLFAFAGLWERWKDETGETLETCCIITCEPNEMLAKIHNRMPVILDPADYDKWLTGTPAEALALLKAFPAEEMRAYPVSPRVNNARNDGPDLVQEAD